MTTKEKAWELIMALVASGKIDFDTANYKESCALLSEHLHNAEEAIANAEKSSTSSWGVLLPRRMRQASN